MLNLYLLALEFEITVLKNVVIDRLIDQSSTSPIPVGISRKIYSHTKRDDLLRRLWVDFYIWDMMEGSFKTELKSKEVSPRFVKDLAAAQSELLRSEDNIHSRSPPYREDSTAYHRPDPISGVCCCRAEFEGNKHKHRCEYLKEKTDLENQLAKANSKIRELEDDLLFSSESQRPFKRRKLANKLRDSGSPAYDGLGNCGR